MCMLKEIRSTLQLETRLIVWRVSIIIHVLACLYKLFKALWQDTLNIFIWVQKNKQHAPVLYSKIPITIF